MQMWRGTLCVPLPLWDGSMSPSRRHVLDRHRMHAPVGGIPAFSHVEKDSPIPVERRAYSRGADFKLRHRRKKWRRDLRCHGAQRPRTVPLGKWGARHAIEGEASRRPEQVSCDLDPRAVSYGTAQRENDRPIPGAAADERGAARRGHLLDCHLGNCPVPLNAAMLPR